MSAPHGPVTRIKSLVLKNFKGFRTDHELSDLDADIVLLTGPNGHGKTGLLEAMTLALTGWHDPKLDPVRHLISRIPETKAEETEANKSRPEAEARIKLLALFGEENPEEQPIEWCLHRGPLSDGSPANPQHRNLPQSRLDNLLDVLSDNGEQETDTRNAAALKARLSTFFQDRMDNLFDETASGATLRDVFEPAPSWVKQVQEAIAEAERELDGAVAKLQDKAQPLAKALYPTLDQHIEAFKEPYQRFCRETQDPRLELPDNAVPDRRWPELPDNAAPDCRWRWFLQQLVELKLIQGAAGDDRKLTATLEETLVGERGAIAALIREARRRLRPDVDARRAARQSELEKQIHAIEQEQRDIDKAFPHLENDLNRFAPADRKQPGALPIFQSLAANAARWSRMVGAQAEPSPPFVEVLQQLAAVDPDQAGQCAQAIEDWLSPRRQAHQRLDELEAQEQRLRHELEQLRGLADVQRLQGIERALRTPLMNLRETWEEIVRRQDFEHRRQRRKRARESLAQARSTMAALNKALTALIAPSEALLQQLVATANWVLDRFSMVPGVAPLRLEAESEEVKEEDDGSRRYKVRTRLRYKVRTEDGRELLHLSTGQRAQFGIALLLAQNREVSSHISHRVLFLDDVSSAYDLSNLTREAVLWRQLAYGAKPPFKRQIFISSHHEDMTSHLLDLLAPPDGGRMRLIRLQGWNAGSGPQLEAFQVEPTANSDRDGAVVGQFIESITQEKYLWRSG